MSRKTRLILFIISAAGLLAVMFLGLGGLPGFGRYPGPYGDLISARVVQERHVTNAPTAINFDYRGLDTLGEEFILFASVAAILLLLRTDREVSDSRPEPRAADRPTLQVDDALSWFGFHIAWVTGIFGVYVILHGQLTPGGGFHGGVIIGSAALLLFLTNGARAFHTAHSKEQLDGLDAIGAGAYALIGIAIALTGAPFLKNILPLGKVGELTSGGTIPLINFGVGVEVFAAFALLFSEFIKEMRNPEGDLK